MATGNSSQPKKKADVLIMLSRSAVTKADEILSQTQVIDSHLGAVMEHSKMSLDETIRQTDGIYQSVEENFSKVSQELSYLSMQNESIFSSLQERLDGLDNAVNDLATYGVAQPADAESVGTDVVIDYDLIADRVAERIPVTEGAAAASATAAEIDYDLLSEKIAKKMPATTVNMVGGVGETPAAKIDYDELSQRVAERIPVQETISPDYIASKVAEQIVIPANEAAEIDYELLARRVAQYLGPVSAMPSMTVLPTQAGQSMMLDYEYLADKVVSKMSNEFFNQPQSVEIDYDLLADKLAERIQPAAAPAPEFDYEALADMVAARMPAPTVEVPELDIDELAAKVASRMPAPAVAVAEEAYAMPEIPEVDYEALADKVAERVLASKDPLYETPDFDYETLANMVVDKLPATVTDETAAATGIDYDYLADKVSERIPASAETVSEIPEFDYDLLAQKVSEYVPAAQVAEETKEVADLDYEAVAARLAELMPAPIVEAQADVLPEFDYDMLAQKVVEHMPESEPAQATLPEFDYEEMAFRVTEHMPAPIVEAQADVLPEFDYDLLAQKVVELMPATETAAAPATVEIDYEELAAKVSENIPAPVVETANNENFDYDYLARKIAEIGAIGAVAGVTSAATVNIDEEEIADQIVTKLGSIKADDFDIIVDDDGCESLSKAICDRLDYEIIAASVAEKLRSALDINGGNGEDIDVEELANRISDKLSFASISEDAIADKAAAALSNYLPEIDCDDIADKVASQLISTLPQEMGEHTATVAAVPVETNVEIDYDALADKVSAQVIAALPQEETVEFDYDGLADRLTSQVLHALPESIFVSEEPGEEPEEESVTAIEFDYDALAEKVATQVVAALPENNNTEDNAPRFDSIDRDLDVILALLANGVKVVEETAAATATVQEEEKLVTVSDVVDESPSSTPPDGAEEAEEAGEDDSDPKTLPSGDDEIQVGIEFSETSGGVDFANMMKFNRSFIARIIQSTDDQKEYYGRLKTALLSYKKVNSNIAWAAERFHKGRETIARMKIRGKTLMLYLALDPNEFPESVYHQKDVSDNKSLAGTPLAVKVMSPLGVKKAIRLIDAMLEKREGIKRNVPERDYAEMYPYESMEELIEDGLVQDMRKG